MEGVVVFVVLLVLHLTQQLRQVAALLGKALESTATYMLHYRLL